MLGIIFCAISILVSLLFVIAIKYYIKTDNLLFLYGVLAIDILSIYVYFKLLSEPNSCILYCISKIITIILVLLLSIMLFEENISTKQWIGISLSCIALVLIMN